MHKSSVDGLIIPTRHSGASRNPINVGKIPAFAGMTDLSDYLIPFDSSSGRGMEMML
jgi:hypothetical protein